jgi:glycosyltransferase involved in cell wall biosynthesis
MTPRIGLSWVGDPRHPTAWSGTTLGLAGGLEQAGAEVVPINVELAPRVRYGALTLLASAHLRRAGSLPRAQAVARMGGAMSTLRTGVARLRVRGVEPLDGVIQIGTGYLLPPRMRTVTYEDMTVPQAVQSGYALWQLLPPRAVRSRMATQAAAYGRARACCAATPWAARSMVADYGVPDAKVHVVGIGRNHELTPGDRDWGSPRFLLVGLDWERKNGPAVLRAFEHLRAVVPEARLDVVGSHPTLRAAGVTGHGRLRLDHPEEGERLHALFAQATCFVMPSRVEPAGLVYAEAAAAGVPSIGTRSGGAPFLIGNGGLSVDPSDERALLRAMTTIAKPETAARLGALAHARSRLFTWRAVAERLLRALAPAGVQPQGLAPFL